MTLHMGSVLIVDDDVELCKMLKFYLEPHGIDATVRHNGHEAVEELRRREYDLIVLDVMLPGLDGFSLLRAIRKWTDVSVLLLTARGGPDDRVRGFEVGADDYLAKPFYPPEFLARVKAILRRVAKNRGGAHGRIQVSDVSMDVGSRSVWVAGHSLDLTDVEFELLLAFLESPRKILVREILTRRVFAREFQPEDRSLDMCVSRLRRKLGLLGTADVKIKTVRGIGYLLSI